MPSTSTAELPTVNLGPLPVACTSRTEVVRALVDGSMRTAGIRPFTGFAVHVGGLSARRDRDYVTALNQADVVYPDGVSVVLLARLAGGHDTQRSGTTDIGWDVVTNLRSRLGRAPRLALVGGPRGLAERAGKVLEAEAGALTVLAEHGYHDDWSDVLAELGECAPDVVLVGLGAPAEMQWVAANRDKLPPCLVLTCGGWFGFLVGDEQRAPQWLQAVGGEWLYRLAQAPRRLASRYARGVGAAATLAVQVLLARPSVSTRVTTMSKLTDAVPQQAGPPPSETDSPAPEPAARVVAPPETGSGHRAADGAGHERGS